MSRPRPSASRPPSPDAPLRARFRLPLWALVGVLACSCDEPQRPWQAAPDGKVKDASKPFLPATAAPRPGGAGGGSSSSHPSAGDNLPRSSRGGLWRSCYRGFRATSTPARDIHKLGLLCGPANGMSQYGKTLLSEAGQAPANHLLELHKGSCYRLFAVAAAGPLQVIVAQEKGPTAAQGQSDGRWLVLDAERPWCVLADGRFRVKVSGSGARSGYALQLWRLTRSR